MTLIPVMESREVETQINSCQWLVPHEQEIPVLSHSNLEVCGVVWWTPLESMQAIDKQRDKSEQVANDVVLCVSIPL